MARGSRFTRDEYLFALLISVVHAFQHIFFRILPPLIPILVVQTDNALWQLGLLVSVYMLSGGLFQAPMGVLSDRIDRRLLLVPAFVAMSGGYLLFGAASAVGRYIPGFALAGSRFTGDFVIMALGMLVAGLGYSVIHPVGYPLISVNVAPANKGKVLGMWGSASKIGDAAAPFLIGALIVVFRWETIVVAISVIGLAFAASLHHILKSGRYETRPPTHGQQTNAPGAYPRELYAPLTIIVVAFSFILFASNGLMTFAPVFVSEVYGFSLRLFGLQMEPASVAGFYFGAMMISGAVAQLLVGSLSDWYDRRAVVIALLGISAGGMLLLSFVTIGPVVLFAVFVVLGVTLYGLNPARDALVSDITPAEFEGRTVGFVWTLSLIITAGYPVLIGYVGDVFGLRVGIAVLATGAVLAVGSVALLYLPRMYRA